MFAGVLQNQKGDVREDVRSRRYCLSTKFR